MFFKKKNKTLLCFRHFAEKHSDISEEIFQQGCKKSFPNVQRDILKERDIFWRRKLVFYWIPAFEQKSLLVWGKCLSKVIRTPIYPSKEAFCKFFWNEIYIFSFHFKKWAKSFRFWRKNICKVVKTRCSEEHFEENWSFCSKNYKLIFFRVWVCFFSKLDKTVAAVLTKQFSIYPEEHVEEKCFSFDENPFFCLDFQQKIFFSQQYIVSKNFRTGLYR